MRRVGYGRGKEEMKERGKAEIEWEYIKWKYINIKLDFAVG